MNFSKRYIKIYTFLSVCLIACIIGGTIFYKNIASSKITDNIPINYIDGVNAFDASNLSEVVGFCDYVFVGKVNSELGNVYNSIFPKTQYNVTVIDDIKGNLSSYGEVTINKVGGLSEDKSEIILSENDFLPEQGEIYIFTAFVSGNGELCVQGENSNVLISDSENLLDTNKSESINKLIDNIQNHDSYKNFKNAKAKEKVYNKKRFDYKP